MYLIVKRKVIIIFINLIIKLKIQEKSIIVLRILKKGYLTEHLIEIFA